MSTRSSARNLFPPLDNPELTIQIRSCTDPTLLNDFEMAAEGNDDLPVPDLRTMKELYRPSLNGRGGPIAPIAIQPTNFGLKNDMIQQSIKVNGVTDNARLYLFPHSLTHHDTTCFDHLQRNSINTFEQMAKMFLGKYFPPSMVTKLKNEITKFRQHPDESLFEAWERYKLSIDRCPNHNMLLVTQIDTFYNGLTLRHRDTINAAARGTFMKRRPKECYDLIKNMTAHHNDWDTSAQWSESSSSITSSFDTKITALKAEMVEINKILMRVLQVNQQVKAVTPNCETCGGPYSFNDCPATVGNTQNVCAAGAYHGNSYQPQVHQPQISQPQVVTTNEFTNFMKANDAILKNMQTNMTSLTNSNLELKNMLGQFMKMNTASSSGSGTLPVECETKATKDMVHPTNNKSTKDVQPLVVQTESPILNSEPVVAPIIEPVASLSLLTNKDKLFELARTLLNEHCSVVFLKNLSEKLRDPDKFLIPYDFPRMAECLALADLDASINLMPLSVWNKLFLLDLSPTCMTLELADRLISRPVGVVEDVFDKVEVDAFLALEDEPTSPEVDQSYEDFEPVVQHQRRVNPKIHDVIKNEVLKPLDAGLIYPISDNPWRCEDTNLCLNWEKNHFMVKEGIVLGHKISKNGIEVDKSKVDVIARLPHPTTVKGIRSFLGHADFYRSNTMNEAESNYTTTEKEMLAVVYAFEKFWSYLIMNKSIVYTNHLALKYLFAKKDSNARLFYWVLLLQEFTFKVIDIKGAENLATDHLSRLENPHQNVVDPKEINQSFPLETLNLIWNPRAIISKRGTHFCNDQFAKVMLKFGVTHRLATPYHPQISGRVEVSNRGLKRILERTVGENCASWSDKLDDAL
nr:reverse transcriptase domain-containing protein [Tanacetum cinerariifolium]